MCKMLEDMRNEAAREAAREATLIATKETRRDNARSLLKLGLLTHEQIAEALKLSLDEVKAIAHELAA